MATWTNRAPLYEAFYKRSEQLDRQRADNARAYQDWVEWRVKSGLPTTAQDLDQYRQSLAGGDFFLSGGLPPEAMSGDIASRMNERVDQLKIAEATQRYKMFDEQFNVAKKIIGNNLDADPETMRRIFHQGLGPQAGDALFNRISGSLENYRAEALMEEVEKYSKMPWFQTVRDPNDVDKMPIPRSPLLNQALKKHVANNLSLEMEKKRSALIGGLVDPKGSWSALIAASDGEPNPEQALDAVNLIAAQAGLNMRFGSWEDAKKFIGGDVLTMVNRTHVGNDVRRHSDAAIGDTVKRFNTYLEDSNSGIGLISKQLRDTKNSGDAAIANKIEQLGLSFVGPGASWAALGEAMRKDSKLRDNVTPQALAQFGITTRTEAMDRIGKQVLDARTRGKLDPSTTPVDFTRQMISEFDAGVGGLVQNINNILTNNQLPAGQMVAVLQQEKTRAITKLQSQRGNFKEIYQSKAYSLNGPYDPKMVDQFEAHFDKRLGEVSGVFDQAIERAKALDARAKNPQLQVPTTPITLPGTQPPQLGPQGFTPPPQPGVMPTRDVPVPQQQQMFGQPIGARPTNDQIIGALMQRLPSQWQRELFRELSYDAGSRVGKTSIMLREVNEQTLAPILQQVAQMPPEQAKQIVMFRDPDFSNLVREIRNIRLDPSQGRDRMNNIVPPLAQKVMERFGLSQAELETIVNQAAAR